MATDINITGHNGQLTAPSSAEVIQFQPRPSKYHLRLTDNLLQSTAWDSLSAIERALYVDIASKFNGRNNGKISYSIRDGAKALRLSRRTIRRALKRLQELGLLRRIKHGYFDPGTGQAKGSEWHLPASEAVATTGQCLGSSGHQGPQAVATRDTKNVDKEVDKNLRLPRKEETEEEKKRRWRAEGKSEFTGLPKWKRGRS